jgi:hypothetical protein
MLGMTVARKNTDNALVSQPLPPSYGAVPSQLQNIGDISNSSFEVELTAHPIESRVVSWTTSMALSQLRNKLVALGPFSRPPTNGTLRGVSRRYVPGYPIDGVWALPLLGYDDVNHNDIIEASEIRIGDTAVYAGRSSPSSTIGWQNSLSFWTGRLTVSGNFTYENGATQENSTLSTQCNLGNCRYAVVASSTPAQQALAVSSGTTPWAYLERVSVFRFNEFSLTYNVPTRFLRRLQVRNASVAILGRNLKMWSHYRGVDPDVNTSVAGDDSSDRGGVPQPRQWYVRVRLGY